MCNKRDRLPVYIAHHHPLGVPPFDAYRVSFWDKSNQPLSISECDAPQTARGPSLRWRFHPPRPNAGGSRGPHLRRLQNRPRVPSPRRRPVLSSFRVACALRGNPRTEVMTDAPPEVRTRRQLDERKNPRTGVLLNCPRIKEV